LTGPNTYFEDFSLGDLIVHANGRTITDEHMPWTYSGRQYSSAAF
jgi:2-methylfumaryl-CoA hydratase